MSPRAGSGIATVLVVGLIFYFGRVLTRRAERKEGLTKERTEPTKNDRGA